MYYLNHIVAVLVWLCLPISLQAQKQIIISFNESDFNYKENNGQLYIDSDIYPFGYGTETNALALPEVPIRVLIPAYCSYQRHSLTYNTRPLRYNVTIMPKPICVPTSIGGESDVRPYLIQNSSNKRNVESLVRYVDEEIMDGYKMLSFLVQPFTYNSESRCLFFNPEMELSIDVIDNSEQNRSQSSLTDYVGQNMRREIESLVVNPEDLPIFYPSQEKSILKSGITTLSEYIIVTPDSFVNVLQPLVDWKIMKGIRTKILTTEEIYQNYVDSSNQLKIKHALYDYYNNEQHSLRYVLLAGNIDLVPSQMCRIYEKNDYGGTILVVSDSVPSDLYYGCFDKAFNWDGNGNGIFGEAADSLDLEPEIYISRLPFSNTIEARRIIQRIINYEMGIIPNWKNNLLMCGAELFTTFMVDSVTKSDAQVYCENIYKYHIQPYTSNLTKKGLFDTGGDFPAYTNPRMKAVNVQEQLENGYSCIFIDSHGYEDQWYFADPNEQRYTCDFADSLSNPTYTIIVTSACQTNAFDKGDTCLSQAFFKNPNSGVVAYSGCSRNGYFYKMIKGLGPSDCINAEIFMRMYDSYMKESWGQIVKEAKSKYAIYAENDTTPFRNLLLGINPLGDPEMIVWPQKPYQNHHVTMSLNDGVLYINGFSGAVLCIMSIRDGGESTYIVERDFNSGIYEIGEDEYTVCITNGIHLPYIATISHGQLYIQNRTISDDCRIVANEVFMGSNVRDDKPHGPVIVDSGTTTVIGRTKVQITKGFKVRLGAQLKIQND